MILAKIKNSYLALVKEAVLSLYPDSQQAIYLITETPKNLAWGDFAIPLFPIVKETGIAPNILAQKLIDILKNKSNLKTQIMGAYLNVFVNRATMMQEILSQISNQGSDFYQRTELSGQKIMLEFSSPNTNKPLHLGHMRNNCLGESLSRILKNCGAEVFKVSIINDRGVHICKSMLAYEKFGNGATPESLNMKGDHFVGDFYVKFSNWTKKDPKAEEMAQKTLIDWEAGDPHTLDLWKKMNGWALQGMQETYDKTGISFDKFYFESNTYKLGRNIILQGLKDGIFFKAEDGSIRLDISELGQDNNEDEEPSSKVFLRSDGTSIYISQDLGTAVERHKDFSFDRLIYVVANEQQRHFQILFYALKKLGFPWANALYHLSYGMVNLPDGKMKSREGTVVDADDLIATLAEMAKEEIFNKARTEQVDQNATLKIALAAIHYYLLQVSPVKDISFNPKESLSFTGNTGPYLQYAIARAHSLLNKDEAIAALGRTLNSQCLELDEEWQIIKLIDETSETILQAANEFAPSLLANKLYDVAKTFNKFYHDTVILSQENADLVTARCYIVQSVKICLSTGLYLLNIPVLDHM